MDWKEAGTLVQVPVPVFTDPGEVTGPFGILIPSSLRRDVQLKLALLGFWPELHENVEGLVAVITGIKGAISQLINVENVNVYMSKDKGPVGPFRIPSLPPYCWEFVLVLLELPEQ